jgi:DNA-binding MarR family transcriptional regulator
MIGHELAMMLRAAYLAMHRQTDAALAPSGVTADQFVVLAALAEGAALTQSELVTRTASDPNTLRAMLVLLERRGLVERSPHPTDGRARSVALTREGRSLFKKLWRRSASVREQLVAPFASEETNMLIVQLRQIVTALGSERIDRPETRRRLRAGAAT